MAALCVALSRARTNVNKMSGNGTPGQHLRKNASKVLTVRQGL